MISSRSTKPSKKTGSNDNAAKPSQDSFPERYIIHFCTGQTYNRYDSPDDLRLYNIVASETSQGSLDLAMTRAQEYARLEVMPGLAGKAWASVYLMDQKIVPCHQPGYKTMIATSLVWKGSYKNVAGSAEASTEELKLNLTHWSEALPERTSL